MRSMTNGRVTGLAVLVSATLVAGGAVLLSGPATAHSAPLTYTCAVATVPNVGTFNYDLTINWDTDAPASFVEGTSVDNVTTAGGITVDPDAVSQLKGLGADHVIGSALVPMTVNGGAWDRAMTVISGEVPPDDFPMIMVISTAADGVLPSGPVGQIPIASGAGFTATIVAVTAIGTQVGPTLNFTCVLNPGDQNQSVDVVDVLADPGPTGSTGPTGPTAPTDTISTTTATTPATSTATATSAPTTSTAAKSGSTTKAGAVYRDAKDKLVAKAKVVADQGGAATGEVKLVLKRNGVKLKTATVDLNDLGKAKRVFKKITKAGTYKVVARYLGSATLARSSDSVKVTV